MQEVKVVKCYLTGIRNPVIKIIGIYEENLDLILYNDDQEVSYNLQIDKENKSFVLTANILKCKIIKLYNKNNFQDIILIKNKTSKRILKKISTFLLDLFTDIIYEENDFVGIETVNITGVKNPVIEIKGFITKEKFDF